MDIKLTDLYTPQELAAKRISFLERLLSYYAEVPVIVERATIIGHKLAGTGGTLGLTDLADRGRRLQPDTNQGAASELLEQQLELLRPEIEATIRREQQLLEK